MQKILIPFLLYFYCCSAFAYSYIKKTPHIYACFAQVESYERSPTKRNYGFDLCLKYHDIENYEMNCPRLANHYFGLAAKQIAMNRCINQTTTYQGCIHTSSSMPTYPGRMERSIQCLQKYIHIVSPEQCQKLAHKYYPIRQKISLICTREFSNDEESDASQPEVITY
jgi:hypothetical protein